MRLLRQTQYAIPNEREKHANDPIAIPITERTPRLPLDEGGELPGVGPVGTVLLFDVLELAKSAVVREIEEGGEVGEVEGPIDRALEAGAPAESKVEVG